MKFSVVLPLLARRSFWITGAIWLLLICSLLAVTRTALYLDDRFIRTAFRFVYVAFTIGSLLALGGFIARATAELEGVRLAKTVPGFRRKVNAAIVLLVPLVASATTGFIYAALPDQFGVGEIGPVFLSAAFLFSLGLGLGWSWLQFVVLVGFLYRIRWFFEQLQTSPWLYSLIAAGACAMLLWVRHRRFLTGKSVRRDGLWSWLAASFSIGATPWRSEKHLPDRPGWSEALPSVALPKLIKAGALERMGHGAHGLVGRTWLSTVVLFTIYTGVVIWASTGQNLITTWAFFVHVFLRGDAHPVTDVMRVFFATMTGAMAFLCSLLFDTTLKSNLWHPVSRRQRARAVFFSHLKQNALFVTLHSATAFGVVALFDLVTPYGMSWRALNGFVFPAIYAFVLMPIPQAMFPNGADTFRQKADPKTQLIAGIIGGGMSLLVAYWTFQWPHRLVHDQLHFGVRLALLGVTAVAVYAGYYQLLVARFAKCDLRWRTA
jgi:hypothetical protein